MKHYEVFFCVHPDQSDQVPSMVERYKKMVTESGGLVHRFENLGRRRLAYPVAKIHKGHYLLFNIECTQQTLEQLQHLFRFNDAILRYIVVLMKEAQTEQSAMMKSLEKQEALEKQYKQRQERNEKAKLTTEENIQDAQEAEQVTQTEEEQKTAEETEAQDKQIAQDEQTNQENQETKI